jgi:urease accessory protein
MTTTTTTEPLDELRLARLLHLASPALPIGAFAYSQGLEHAVEARWVTDEASARAWILGLLGQTLRSLEVPLVARLHAAWSADDAAGVRAWNDLLFATRGAAELQAEDRRLGAALARVLETLDVAGASAWAGDPRVTYTNMFALAAVRWRLAPAAAATALLFAWCENQVAAALRLVPLGQSSGQRILAAAAETIPAIVREGLALPDDELGWGAPGVALASALHETQYSRIFRS